MNKTKQENSSIKLLEILTSVSPNKVFLSVVIGAIGGFAYSLLVPLIMLSLQPELSRFMQPEFESSYWLFGMFEVSNPKQALTFFVVCMLILFSRVMSGTLMLQVAVDSTVGLRKKMYKRISQIPIQKLDQIGPSRLLTAINNDVEHIANGASTIPTIMIAIMTFFGMLSFLLYLQLEVFLTVLGLIAFGFVTYQIPIFFSRKYIMKGRNGFDRIQDGIKGLIYGAKELKLNKEKQKAFLNEELYNVEDQYSASIKKGRTFLVFANNYSNLISFFTIGLVAYALANYLALSRDDVLGAIMILLYIMGPLTVLVGSMNSIVAARVAGRKLAALFEEMPIEPSSNNTLANQGDVQELKLKNIEYTHATVRNEDSGFHIGPIDLSFKRGEVVYLVGGNGSGKTTLGKVLSLHYQPSSGSVYHDADLVTDDNRDACRESIFAIYSDFYLFPKLFGIAEKGLDSRATRLLELLGLDKKVTIKNGTFSSTKLSDGQKKRLALLVSYLEDRPVHIFDEWAADQDPEFKDVFYNHIVPYFKELNKIVVVITHDDRYFHLADKIVRLENGKVSKIIKQGGAKQPSENKISWETADVN
ncbi:cyclic peptide export ABC transporter [Pseudoalteromonas piscicida]|uniref:cyclic peptide export ABC transporter n=1 Tax=Pseudoalteromonas piscicida TaxID=43662 RepID=UPI002739BA8D|nr:cyclic peptide export ABC transporter [Pseudoalteromonas piscicida]MDP4489529.1 cyclic peptide export ABC transporter [Pseudoalteromonas piscicida]